jgi:hypothetical protein
MDDVRDTPPQTPRSGAKQQRGPLAGIPPPNQKQLLRVRVGRRLSVTRRSCMRCAAASVSACQRLSMTERVSGA